MSTWDPIRDPLLDAPPFSAPVRERPLLTVDEVAKLASAGVRVEMKDIQIVSNQHQRKFDASHLTDPLVDRDAPPFSAPVRERPLLTVDEVAKLASAGVRVEMKDIQIVSNQHQRKFDASHLTDPLVDRMNRNGHKPFNTGRLSWDFFLSAAEHQGTVYVFFYNGAGPPLVMEDQSNLYPSDALLAKITLYRETHPQPEQGILLGANSAQVPGTPYIGGQVPGTPYIGGNKLELATLERACQSLTLATDSFVDRLNYNTP